MVQLSDFNPTNNLDLIAIFALPFFIFKFPEIKHKIGYQFAIAVIASYCVGISILLLRCRKNSSSLNVSKSSKLLITLIAIFCVYVVLILISPYLRLFPPARILATIFTSNLGAIITGLIGVTCTLTIKSVGKTCNNE